MESNGTESRKHDTSSMSGNDIDVDNADIKSVYDKESMAKVQLTTECNVFAIGQQHTEQPEFNNEGGVDYIKNELRKLKGNSVDTKFAKPSVLGKPPLQTNRKQPVVRQLTAFKSERPPISKSRFAFQVDVKNDLSKPVTPHYLPKVQESAFAKPHHVIVPSESRNSSKNMPRFSSNGMVHHHYLEEARKLIQCTSINVQEEQTLDLSAGTPFNMKKERIKALIKENVMFGRPMLHRIALIQEISARPKS
ncbi:hypothetical protein Tco_0368266 [Tanacetum coccineum]